MTDSLPALRFVLPPASENRWTDLLAVLIETDPQPLASMLGLCASFTVHREVAQSRGARTSDRLDLLLLGADGIPSAVIEAKVLADLGPAQLRRYGESFPSAGVYALLHLAFLPVAVPADWQGITWESVLDAYAASSHPWVATTARAWRAQLDALVPHVDDVTVWNDVPVQPGDFELALRARMAWLAGRMNTWCPIDHDLVPSTAGGSWVVRMRALIPGSDHVVAAEMEEGMTAQAWRRDPDRPYSGRMVGPSVWVGLQQHGVTTSAGFDWPGLVAALRATVIDQDGEPTDDRAWARTRPNFRDPGDRARAAAAEAPAWVGKGFGMAQASKYGTCMFGARFTLAAASTLAVVDQELQDVMGLVERMAHALAGDRASPSAPAGP